MVCLLESRPNRSTPSTNLQQDASAAALFTACKIEDTPKKSREILCAAYNLKLSPADQLAPDDSVRNPFFYRFVQ
jgi:hypothetical protein